MNDLARSEFDEYDDFSTDAGADPQEQFLKLVTDNPLPSILAAAAVGAGLMALATMTSGSRSSAAVAKEKLSKVKASKVDVADEVADQARSFKSQLADLAQAVLAALPSKGDVKDKAGDVAGDAQSSVKSAREALNDSIKSAGDSWKSAASTAGSSLKSASDTLRSALGDTFEQASDVLQKYQPQVDAVGKLARQNPMWAALIAGAAGTLIGWQVLGTSKND